MEPPSLKCHDTFIETLTVSCENGVYMPLGFKCADNHLVAKIYSNSRFQGIIKPGARLGIYLVRDGLVVYSALKKTLKPVYSERKKCYTIEEIEDEIPKLTGTVTEIEKKEEYTQIHVQLNDDRGLETLSRKGYTRADGCLIEILVYYTKCKAGVLSPEEYYEIYRLCTRSILRSTRNKAYIKALDDLKC